MLTSRARKRAAVLLISGLVLSGVIAGCSSSGTSSSSAAKEPEAVTNPNMKAAAPGAVGAPGAAPAGGLDAGPKAAPTLPANQVQRSIIYDGSITVRVSNVDSAAAAAESLANGTGGYVGGDQRQIDASRSMATLTLRVPAAHFDSTLAAIAELGKEQNRQVSTQDVTEQVIDVQSRLKTQQASVDRIRALLAQATSIAQIVSVESELTQRESDLESLEAQLRSLTDLTSLSTITVTLLGPDAKVVPKPATKTGFVGGLKSGWHTFLDSLKVLLTIVGAILPFVLVIGVPVLVVWWLTRRRRRSRFAASTVAPTALPAADGPPEDPTA